MSFTEDELQAFSSILEQRFAAHRQEMEQAIDQRLENFQQQGQMDNMIVDQGRAARCGNWGEIGRAEGSDSTDAQPGDRTKIPPG